MLFFFIIVCACAVRVYYTDNENYIKCIAHICKNQSILWA